MLVETDDGKRYRTDGRREDDGEFAEWVQVRARDEGRVEPAVVCEEELKEDGKTQTTATARYFEVKIEHLGENGCVRVGWMTKRGEMNAPVGFDNKGYGYHAETGLKYHEARLKKYGEPYGEGDVIGCYMYLDEKIVKKKEDSTAELKENGDGGDIDSNAVADDEA